MMAPSLHRAKRVQLKLKAIAAEMFCAANRGLKYRRNTSFLELRRTVPTSLFMYVSMCVHLFACVFACMSLYIYIYIHAVYAYTVSPWLISYLPLAGSHGAPGGLLRKVVTIDGGKSPVSYERVPDGNQCHHDQPLLITNYSPLVIPITKLDWFLLATSYANS